MKLRQLTVISTQKLTLKSTRLELLRWVCTLSSHYSQVTADEAGPYPDIMPMSAVAETAEPGGVFMPRVVHQDINFPDVKGVIKTDA